MSVSRLKEFCAAKNQRFLCYGAGGKDQLTYVASIGHVLNRAATPEEMAWVEITFKGIPEEFLAFYREHNGALLFTDKYSDAAGIRIAPIEEWEALKGQVEDWIVSMGEDEELEDEDLDWLSDWIVFGEVPHSGNYFALSINGEKKGDVVYFSHEESEPVTYANSFVSFVERITADPARELFDLGCYTRYSDGETAIQWIPKQLLVGDQQP